MPIVISNRQRIFFRYEGERGAFLMLHHGLFGSHQDWYRGGYVEELAKEFRLVIPDARGHGRSDRPTDPGAYRAQDFAEDLVEIINGLGIRNLHFLGYGMGALIGLEMLRRFPERVRIAVLGGEAPLTLPPVREHWQALAAQLRGDTLPQLLADTLPQLLADLGARDRLVRLDPAEPPEDALPAAQALLDALAGWDVHGEERISVTSPVTLFAGAGDPAAERVERARSCINRARLVIFPGLNHASLFTERTQVTQELVRLLKSGRRDDGDAQHRRHGPEGAEAGSEAGRPGGGEERGSGRRDDRPPDQQDERRQGTRPGDRLGDGASRRERDFGRRPYRQDSPGRSGGSGMAQETPPSGMPAEPPESAHQEEDAPADEGGAMAAPQTPDGHTAEPAAVQAESPGSPAPSAPPPEAGSAASNETPSGRDVPRQESPAGPVEPPPKSDVE